MPVVIADTTVNNTAVGSSLNLGSSSFFKANLNSSGFELLTAGSSQANITTTSRNGGQLAGLRNKIINGAMTISQRGTSFSTSGQYYLDRWRGAFVGGAAITVTQTADFPTATHFNDFQFSLRATVNTADTSIAAGDFTTFWQPIEGVNVRDLIGRTFTVSFWVRSSVTGTYSVAFRNSGADRSYVRTYTINTANTWEWKSVTVNGGLITTGTWNWTNGIGLEVLFTVACGTTYQTTAGAWQTGNFLAATGQVNGTNTAGNIFAITGVQLEVGDRGTAFEHLPFGITYDLCRRYYQEIGVSAGGEWRYEYWVNGATTMYFPGRLPVLMRATPSTAVFGGTWATAGLSAASITATVNTFRMNLTSGAATTAYVTNTGASARLIFDAEF